jgi:hypothetical protein
MPLFSKQDFSKGWCPSDNEFNGREDGLLRMDNCHLDDLGVVRNIRGYKTESTGVFGDITSLYSRVVNLSAKIGAGYPVDAKVRYAYDNTAKKLLRNYGPTHKSQSAFEIEVFNSASNRDCAFITALGHNFCINGDKKIKDRGDVQTPIGFQSSGPPTVVVQDQIVVNTDNKDGSGFYTRWDTALIEGTSYNKSSNYLLFETSSTSFRGIAQLGKDTATNIDTTNFGAAGLDSPNDVFKWTVRLSDASKVLKIRVEFLLDAPTTVSTTPDVSDYFWYEWEVNSQEIVQVEVTDPNAYNYTDDPDFRENVERTFTSQVQLTPVIRLGNYSWTPLQANRSHFQRVGTDDSKGWGSVKGVRVSVIATEQIEFVFQNMQFVGGRDVLNGTYRYIQVDVRDTGYYNAVGLHSAESSEVYAYNTRIEVTPSTVNAQANECWIFRSSRNTGVYRLIKIIEGTPGFTPAAFIDNLSDIAAQRSTTSLGGLKLEIFRTLLPDNIIGGVWFADRLIYLTYEGIIPSMYLDPDSYDSRFEYQIAADQSEVCYFITKVSEGEIIVGTSNDLYSIKGDFSEIDLGGGNIQLDVSIRGLGIKKPPVSNAHYVDNAMLYYLAEDGWRIQVGSTNESIVANLSLLYRNEERHGIPPVSRVVSNNATISCTMSKGRFLAAMPHVTIDRAMHVYNRALNYWTYYRTAVDDALTVFSEEDGTVLTGGKSSVTNYLRSWDSDSTVALPIFFRTKYFTLSSINRRNDINSASVIVNTGNTNLTLKIYSLNADNSITTTTITPINSNTRARIPLSVNGITQKIAYAFEFSGTTTDFIFYGIEIEYEPRPYLTRKLFVPANNFGSPNRKRVPTWPVVLDSMGSNVTMTPRVDGVDSSPQTLNTSEFRTAYYYWPSDNIGVDFGYTLEGTEYFEPGPLLPPFVFETFPMQAKHVTKSAENFGSTARKRIPTIGVKINTNGSNVTFNPSLDGVASGDQTLNTVNSRTQNYYHTAEKNGVDLSYAITGTAPFEFYEIDPFISETFPKPAKYLEVTPNNLGTNARKRIPTIGFNLNTFAAGATVTPVSDLGNASSTTITTASFNSKDYYYTADNVITDLGFKVQSSIPFEFKEWKPWVAETLPVRAKHIVIDQNDFGNAGRKDVNTIPITINTENNPVTAIPVIDGVTKSSATITTANARTEFYYYTGEESGVNHGISLSGNSEFELYPLKTPSFTSTYPVKAKVYKVPANDLGNPTRKQVNTWPVKINGVNVTLTPRVDEINRSASVLTTGEPSVVNHYFTEDTSGVNYGYTLTGSTPFEAFAPVSPNITETYPQKGRYFKKTLDNLGVAARKRIPTLTFRINTFGNNATLVPNSDGSNDSSLTLNSSEFNSQDYYYTGDHVVTDLGFEITSANPFELADFKPWVFEGFPTKAKYIKKTPDNFGTNARKRIPTLAFKLNSFGASMNITPVSDGVSAPVLEVTSSDLVNKDYYYTTDHTPVDLGYILSGSTAFEFADFKPWVLENLPVRTKYIQFDENDFGKPVRKDVNTIPVRLNSFGQNVTMTPSIDTVNQDAATINTPEVNTTNYYYDTKKTGVNHGFVVNGNNPFELYQTIEPNFTQVYPQKSKYLEMPTTNFGFDGKKRVRNIPFRINTFGGAVTYTASVDGVEINESNFNSNSDIRTVYHLFNDDQFGVDYGGKFTSTTPFELSEAKPPAVVEQFPLPKLLDQIGPLELYKAGNLRSIKLRLVPTTEVLRWRLYDKDTLITSGELAVTPLKHAFYDIDGFNIEMHDALQLLRFEFEADNYFWRLGAWFKVMASGKETTYDVAEMGA